MPRQIIDTESSRPAYIRRRVIQAGLAVACPRDRARGFFAHRLLRSAGSRSVSHVALRSWTREICRGAGTRSAGGTTLVTLCPGVSMLRRLTLILVGLSVAAAVSACNTNVNSLVTTGWASGRAFPVELGLRGVKLAVITIDIWPAPATSGVAASYADRRLVARLSTARSS